MGLEEALILLYLLVDDAYRIVTFGGRLRQRGPEPKLSDVEVLTMEIFGEQQGRHDAGATDAGPSGAKRHGATARPRRSLSTACTAIWSSLWRARRWPSRSPTST